MSSHRYAKNRRDDAQRDSREDQNKSYHHYQEARFSVAPPPPPSINPAHRERNRTDHHSDNYIQTKTRENTRTPHDRFEDNRRSYDFANSSRGLQRSNGHHPNGTSGTSRDKQGNFNRSSDINISNHSSSARDDRRYEESSRSQQKENRAYSGKSIRSPPAHPSQNPLPSTSYDSSRSNDDIEHHRSKTSRRSLNPTSISSMTSPYSEITSSHSKNQDVNSIHRKNHYKHSNSPSRDHHRTIERINKPKENSDQKRNNRNDDRDYHERQFSHNDAKDFKDQLSENNFTQNLDRNHRSFTSKNVRSRSFDRERPPTDILPCEYRRRSSERGNLVRSKHDIEKNNENIIDGDGRQPLISQKEAFQRQQSKNYFSDVKNITPKRKSNDTYSRDKSIPNDKYMMKSARRRSTENQFSNLTPPRENYKSFPSGDNEEELSISNRSTKSRHENRRLYRKSEDGKSESRKNSKRENNVKISRDRMSEIYRENEIKEKRNIDTYNSDISSQNIHKSDIVEGDKVDRYKNEVMKNENRYTEDTVKNRKRSLSSESDEKSQRNKKLKQHANFERKGRKSNELARNEKSNTIEEIKENVVSKDSDLDSASSETKRVSALSRLGPKLSLNERLSSLPETTENFSEQPEHDMDSSEKNSIQHKEQLALRSEPLEYHDKALKSIPPTSSGMQITIHKGPNDQTQRFVNNDNVQLQWNNVNFGDKKYIELQCPHCKAISVTFNEYGTHFQSNVHSKAMKKVKIRLQKELQALRRKQREAQKVIDSTNGENNDNSKKDEKSGYCKICKLIFKQLSIAEHEKTEFHKRIFSFLYPECTFCKVPKFFSPMAFQKHIATLGHIKKRSKAEQNTSGVPDKFSNIATEFEEGDEGADHLFGEFDPDEFEILDEVGDEDELIEETLHNQNSCNKASVMQNDPSTIKALDKPSEQDTSANVRSTTETNNETVGDSSLSSTVLVNSAPRKKMDMYRSKNQGKSSNDEIVDTGKSNRNLTSTSIKHPVGEEFVKIVEMLFCDLCHKYLPRIDQEKDIESLLNEHCLTIGHQTAYNKYEKHHFDTYSRNSSDIDNNQKSTQAQPCSADEDQLDFEAEDSVSAAETSPIVEEPTIE